MSDPVRWMLADEVGLGKTVEACLILNHLVRTGRAERLWWWHRPPWWCSGWESCGGSITRSSCSWTTSA
jgi:hypothetical protein